MNVVTNGHLVIDRCKALILTQVEQERILYVIEEDIGNNLRKEWIASFRAPKSCISEI